MEHRSGTAIGSVARNPVDNSERKSIVCNGCPSCSWQTSMLFHIFHWQYALPMTWVNGQTAQRWLRTRLPKSSHRHVLCTRDAGLRSRVHAVLANRVATHSLCGVGLVGTTGTPTHVPVAAVFQLAENEQTVTTLARMRKINFRDPQWYVIELIGNGLTRQNTAWCTAVHQRDIQRMWELRCEDDRG